MKTVGVRFKRASKIYTFEAPEGPEEACAVGAPVVVETERGMALGTVAVAPAELDKEPAQPLKKVLRIAEERDVVREEKNHELEREARKACMGLISEKGLPMKMLSVECLFDRSKIIFNFASEGRVDFRDLVRDLAKRFHTRIEMRQVGVRDEAKMVGGVGCCGRELCCATWLTDFAPISVRMAKSQNISLNPAKISGICSRLMCCLSYEFSMYEELSKGMPKVGKRVRTPKGEGKVLRRNALDGTFTVLVERREEEIGLEEYLAFKADMAARGESAAPQPQPQPAALRKERPPRDRKPAPPAADKEEADNPPEQSAEGEGDAQKRSSRRRRRRRKKPAQAKETGQDG